MSRGGQQRIPRPEGARLGEANHWLPLPEPSSMLPWIAIVLIAAIFWAFMGLTNSMLFFVIMALALGGSRIAKR